MKRKTQSTFSIFEATESWCKNRELAVDSKKETGSTNDDAKIEAHLIEEPLKIYLTESQNNGHGRGGNSWLNPSPGDALLVTFSFAIDSAPQPITSPALGLAVYESLKSSFSPRALNIKAPNDIYLNDRKVLGLLIESLAFGAHHRLLVGIGLNVFSAPPTVEIAGHLSSDCEITEAKWYGFLDLLTRNLRSLVDNAQCAALSEAQREKLLIALNAHPLLAEKYLSVSPFSDLTTRNKTVSWRDL